MQESLLSPSNVTLFGRVFPLTVDQASLAATLGANRFLREQLAHLDAAGNPDATFARIYAISYEGTFCNLSRPAIFLVHGVGTDIEGSGLSPRGVDLGGTTDDSGLVAKSFDFERSTGFPNPAPPPPKLEEGHGVKYWEYDRGDFSLRLDVTTGTFEDILLEAEIETQLQIGSAARVQISGAARMQISHAARMQIARRGGG